MVHVLASPLLAAVNVVRYLLPDFERLVPPPLKRPATLAPVVFVLLLVGLVLGQVPPTDPLPWPRIIARHCRPSTVMHAHFAPLRLSPLAR